MAGLAAAVPDGTLAVGATRGLISKTVQVQGDARCSRGPPKVSRRRTRRVRCGDAERDWAYDRKSPIGRLGKALDEARAKGWTVVDMKKDWKVAYPFEKK